MTTICIFDKNGKLINIGEWDYQYSTNTTGEQAAGNPLPEGAYSEEREVFTDGDAGRYIAKDPLAEAERWIARHFTTARLLQMKVWWDMLGQSAPKLAASYGWANAITASAAGGATTFAPAPHTFEELVAECVALQ
jgi:hypothetical protein